MSNGILTASHTACCQEILRVNHPTRKPPTYNAKLGFQFVPINTPSISRDFTPRVFYLIFARSPGTPNEFLKLQLLSPFK